MIAPTMCTTTGHGIAKPILQQLQESEDQVQAIAETVTDAGERHPPNIVVQLQARVTARAKEVVGDGRVERADIEAAA